MQHISDLTSQSIRENAGIKSNWEYRQFMQANGKAIMKTDAREYFNASGNNPYYSSSQSLAQGEQEAQQSPILLQNSFDTRTSALVGQESDLKQAYLKKQRMDCRRLAPTVFLQNDKLK
jgi:hypothetical protein